MLTAAEPQPRADAPRIGVDKEGGTGRRVEQDRVCRLRPDAACRQKALAKFIRRPREQLGEAAILRSEPGEGKETLGLGIRRARGPHGPGELGRRHAVDCVEGESARLRETG